ncbi:MAG: acyltransferase family protein [Anaerolineaceae bacterium]|nr:acyltransferase family protein [Anaerolineaceae bacterium]
MRPEENKADRLIWVDCLRGFLILLVVAGHASSPYNTYIYTFHVAAFFILSGFTRSLNRAKSLDLVIKRFFSLLLPYYVLNILFFSFYSFSFRMGLHSFLFGPAQPIPFFERLNIFLVSPQSTTGLAGPLWFILVLFIAEFIFSILQFLCRVTNAPKDIEIPVAFCLGVVGLPLTGNPYFSRWAIDLGLHALIYFSIGLAFQRWHVIKCIDFKSMVPFALIVVVFFGSFYSWEGAAMNWPTRRFVHIPQELFMVISAFILLYWLILLLMKSAPIKKFLNLMGQHTFSIFVWHFLAFKLISVLFAFFGFVEKSVIINDVPLGLAGNWWLVYTSIGISLCLLLSSIAKKIPFLNWIINGQTKPN